MARILKAKYYARGDFMSAQLSSNSSYTWKSILEGRAVLENGLIWRVGNGDRIKITKARWVPNMLEFKVRLREDANMEIEWVNQLLLHNPTRWNSKLIGRLCLFT